MLVLQPGNNSPLRHSDYLMQFIHFLKIKSFPCDLDIGCTVVYFLSQEAQQYAEENGLLVMETSAKTAMNVNDIFVAIGKTTH